MREGRFSSAVSEIAQRYSESVSFDRRLYHHDIAGSIAHASALASAGILSADEFEMIARGLREIENEIAAGKFVWDQSLEDVHMNIEAVSHKRIGPAGAKLHTAAAATIKSRSIFTSTSGKKLTRSLHVSARCKTRSSFWRKKIPTC